MLLRLYNTYSLPFRSYRVSRYSLRYNSLAFSYVVFPFFFFFLISFGGETIWSGNGEKERERREKKKKWRVEYRVELSANICHSCAGIFASHSYPSLSSLGLVTIPRIDSSDGKLPTGLAWLEFLGAKMEIVSIFPFETGFLIWVGKDY